MTPEDKARIEANKTIWKYRLEIADEQVINMPFGSKILSAQIQDGLICIWALIRNPNTETLPYKIWMIGTGNTANIPDNARFIDTFQMFGGRLVFHVFTETFKDE